MKRSAYLILVAVLMASFAFAGCGDDDEPKEEADVTDTAGDTTPDSAGDAEEEVTLVTEDACISAANVAALTAFAADDDCDNLSGIAGDNALQPCGALSCLGDPEGDICKAAPACMADIVETTAGVDVSCANCAGVLGACTIANCASSCIDPSAAACGECVIEKCDAEFSDCAGFSSSEDTCTTYAEGDGGGEVIVKEPPVEGAH